MKKKPESILKIRTRKIGTINWTKKSPFTIEDFNKETKRMKESIKWKKEMKVEERKELINTLAENCFNCNSYEEKLNEITFRALKPTKKEWKEAILAECRVWESLCKDWREVMK
jgi:hypothetical protein